MTLVSSQLQNQNLSLKRTTVSGVVTLKQTTYFTRRWKAVRLVKGLAATIRSIKFTALLPIMIHPLIGIRLMQS